MKFCTLDQTLSLSGISTHVGVELVNNKTNKKVTYMKMVRNNDNEHKNKKKDMEMVWKIDNQ